MDGRGAAGTKWVSLRPPTSSQLCLLLRHEITAVTQHEIPFSEVTYNQINDSNVACYMWEDEQGVAGTKFETANLNVSLIFWTDGKKEKRTEQEQGRPPPPASIP